MTVAVVTGGGRGIGAATARRLARATGQDDTIAAEDLAELQEGIKAFPEEAMRSPGAFGPEIEAPADASDQEKLMAFLGRQS